VKTHKLAAYMEVTAKILRELPDGELIETLEHMLKLARTSKNRNSAEANLLSDVTPISTAVVDRLTNMSSAQIEEFLTTSKEFEGLTRIRELARHLAIKMSRRQNHAALVNMIVRHFEARRMDFTIRGSQVRDESTRKSGSD
jgi:hypothetical protein